MRFIATYKRKRLVWILLLLVTILSSYTAWLLFIGPHRFIITSYGGSGTNWLRKNLNSIPRVVCTQYIYNVELRDGPIKDSINDTTSIEEYFKRIKFFKLYPVKALGNVHGFSYANIATEAKLSKNLTVVNLIRHPIDRIESGHNTNIQLEKDRMRFLANHDQAERRNSIVSESKYYNMIVAKHGASIFQNFENVLFLHTLERQDKAFKDMQLCIADNIPQIRFEDLTKEPHTLIDLVAKITQRKVRLTVKEAQRMLNLPQVNKHHSKSLTAEQKYASWEDWKKYAFKLHIQQDDKRALYESLGYSLAYVTKL